MKAILNSFFKIEEYDSNIRKEVIGGTVTFLTMSYIIFVNPAVLSSTGMDKGALFTVTCLSTIIGTLIAAFWANAPFAMAPGMGLNTFFAYSLVLGKGLSWEQALGVVFLSGIFYFLLTLGGIREKIVNAIPDTLSTAATSGIGLFIAFIGLKNMGLIVKNEATLVSIGKFSPATILSIIGLVIMIFFELKKIKAGILISIIITSIAGVLLGLVKMPTSVISAPPSIAPIFMKLDILGAFKISLIGTIFSFMFIDLFNSLSFMMACYENMDSISVEKRREGLKRMLFVDVSSTLTGSILGTSTVTSFSESAAGISVGARTGLASVVTAFFFLLALLFTPIVEVIPSYATAPALVFVGVFIFKVTMNIDFSDLKLAIPSFLTIIMMPLTASIGDGLSFGFVSYIICFTICGKWREISPVLWIVGILAFVNLML